MIKKMSERLENMDVSYDYMSDLMDSKFNQLQEGLDLNKHEQN